MSETLSRDLLDLSAGEIVEALAARKVGALELADAAIARIEDRDKAINAVVVRDFDRAREAAKAADAALARGERRAWLGLPLSVMERSEVEGLRSTGGGPACWGGIAPTDAIQSIAAIEDSGGSRPAMISPLDTHGWRSDARRDSPAQYSTALR